MTYENVLTVVDEMRNLKQLFINKNKYNRFMKDNYQLKNILNGGRCFILGSGPSLKLQNLDDLANEFVITVNNIARSDFFSHLKTNVHIWEDPVFFDEKDTKEEALKRFTMVNTEDNKPVVMVPVRHKSYIEANDIDKEVSIHYYNPIYVFHKKYDKEFNFCKSVPGFHTVVGEAIALSIYMGAKEIYLLGCDCTSILTYIGALTDQIEAQYAYEFSEKEKNKYYINHYNYYNNNSEAPYYTAYKVIQQYRYLREYCYKRGIKLINATKGGILIELERKDLEDIL